MTETLLMGAVAYDPKVVTIWEGFRRWFVDNGLPFDFLLYTHYERQVDDLVEGRIHAAWNSPLAALRPNAWPAHGIGRSRPPSCAIPTATSHPWWSCGRTRG
jgi:hypothetical protein